MLFSDIPLWSDVLTKTGLKPWFEKLATFFMAMFLISCFFVLYGIRIAGSVYCLPEGKFAHNLSNQDVNYINAVCFNGWKNPLQYADLAAFGFFALIFMCRSFWLLSSQVTKSFTSIVDLDKRLCELDLEPSQLIKMTTAPLGRVSDEIHVAIRHVRACLLTPGETTWPITSVPGMYTCRNVLVIISTGACVGVLCKHFIPSATDKTEFTCIPSVLAATAYTSFQCTHHLSMILYVHLILICASAGILFLIAFCCACYFCPGSQCDDHKHKFGIVFGEVDGNDGKKLEATDEFRRAAYNALFLEVFNKQSRQLGYATSELLKVEANDWLKSLAKQKVWNDEELKKLHWRLLRKKGGKRERWVSDSSSSSTPFLQAQQEIEKKRILLKEMCDTALDEKWYQVYIAAHGIISANTEAPGTPQQCGCDAVNKECIKEASSDLMKYVLAIQEQHPKGEQDLHRPGPLLSQPIEVSKFGVVRDKIDEKATPDAEMDKAGPSNSV